MRFRMDPRAKLYLLLLANLMLFFHVSLAAEAIMAALFLLLFFLSGCYAAGLRLTAIYGVLLALDFMRFSQSRLATIDIYGTFFILLGAYFMLWYCQQVLTVGVNGAVLPMFLGGLDFGLGCASKWTGIYAGAGLAVPGLPEQPRPDAVILGYPVITAGEYAHRGSFVQLAGEDPAAQQAFSLEDKITPRTPPVFVWHTMEDETVPVENTLLLVSALHRAGVPCEAHLFEKGCHGTSLSTAEVNHPSAHRSRWLTLAREWLDDTFDFHLGTGETGG